jgi:hypothetical protein
MSKGAQKAFDAFTTEWQMAGKDTFNWAGAQQAVAQRPNLCEHALLKHGKQKYARQHYRLKS